MVFKFGRSGSKIVGNRPVTSSEAQMILVL